jgi:predicted RNA-binding protein with RPS1 domain
MSDEVTETVVEAATETEAAIPADSEIEETVAAEAAPEEPTAGAAEEMPVKETTPEEPAVEASPDVPDKVNGLAQLKRKEKLQGKVSRLELYGAFIDVGLDTDALIHISQLGTEHVNRVNDVLNVGDEVTVWVEKVDPNRNQLMVTMIEPLAVEWNDLKTGNVYAGNVIRLENYGAFIDIGAEREGLVHISELSHDYVKHPTDVVQVGDEVQVQVLGFSKKKRRIDLSMKALMDRPEDAQSTFEAVEEGPDSYFDEEEMDEAPTAMEIALRRAMGSDYKSESRKGKGKRKRKRRRQQDDILNRTLQRSGE